MLRLTKQFYSYYVPIVGCSFLLDTLYGCKYSPHIGMCNLPHVYVKTVLFCSSGREPREEECQYVHGLIHYLMPGTILADEQTKLELMQFVDAMSSRSVYHNSNNNNNNNNNNNSLADTSSSNINSNNMNATDMSTNNSGEGQIGNESIATNNNNNNNNSSSTINSNSNISGTSTSSSSSPQVSENMTSFLSGALLPAAMARVLLYDAVCVSVILNNYDKIKRDRIALVAARLGVPQHVREAIEKVVVQEHQLTLQKRRLLLLN